MITTNYTVAFYLNKQIILLNVIMLSIHSTKIYHYIG